MEKIRFRCKKFCESFHEVRVCVKDGIHGMGIHKDPVPDPVKGSLRDAKEFRKLGNGLKPSGKTVVYKGNKKRNAVRAVWNDQGVKKGMGFAA